MPRYKSSERPPVGRRVQIEVDGQRYEGTYTIDGPLVTIDTLLLGSRRAAIGDRTPEIAARVALLDLVQARVLR